MLILPVCIGREDNEGGWCRDIHERQVHQLRTKEEDVQARDEWNEAFEAELYIGRIEIPVHMSYPRNEEEKYDLFKTTAAYTKFDEKFPHYRASIPVPHFHSGNWMILLFMESFISLNL